MYTEKLTKRETDVMSLVAKGLSNDVICEKLNIANGTVRTHLTNIYQKYGISEDITVNFSTQRLRAALIYLGLADTDYWIERK